MAISIGFLFCWSFLLFQEAQIPVAKVNVKNTVRDTKPGIFRAILSCLIKVIERNNGVMIIFFDRVHNQKKSVEIVVPCKETAEYLLDFAMKEAEW